MRAGKGTVATVAVAAALVLASILLVRRELRGPETPSRYFTAGRATDLSQLAGRLLELPNTTKVSVVYDPPERRWRFEGGALLAEQDKKHIVRELKHNRLHALWSDQHTMTVMFGHYSARRWYTYSYTSPSYPFKPKEQMTLVRQLTNGWHFSIQ